MQCDLQRKKKFMLLKLEFQLEFSPQENKCHFCFKRMNAMNIVTLHTIQSDPSILKSYWIQRESVECINILVTVFTQ